MQHKHGLLAATIDYMFEGHMYRRSVTVDYLFSQQLGTAACIIGQCVRNITLNKRDELLEIMQTLNVDPSNVQRTLDDVQDVSPTDLAATVHKAACRLLQDVLRHSKLPWLADIRHIWQVYDEDDRHHVQVSQLIRDICVQLLSSQQLSDYRTVQQTLTNKLTTHLITQMPSDEYQHHRIATLTSLISATLHLMARCQPGPWCAHTVTVASIGITSAGYAISCLLCRLAGMLQHRCQIWQPDAN